MQRGNKEQKNHWSCCEEFFQSLSAKISRSELFDTRLKKKLFVIRVYGGFKGKIIEMKSLVVLLTAILLNLILEMIMTFSNVVSF